MTHDPADLFRAQWAIRQNYHAIKRLRTYSADPVLQRMAAEPNLPLAVRHPVLAGAGGK